MTICLEGKRSIQLSYGSKVTHLEFCELDITQFFPLKNCLMVLPNKKKPPNKTDQLRYIGLTRIPPLLDRGREQPWFFTEHHKIFKPLLC